MDAIVSKIVGLGVPGLILITAMGATGLSGGAAITTALFALGPGGILGGIGTLGVIALISEEITQFGFDKIIESVVIELAKQGETKQSIMDKINKYPISKKLKLKLKDSLDKIN